MAVSGLEMRRAPTVNISATPLWRTVLAVVTAVAVVSGCDAPVQVTDRSDDINWRLEDGATRCPPLRVHSSGRFLSIRGNDGPVFILGEAAWGIGWKLDRREVAEYLRKRAGQGFNAIGVIAFPYTHTGTNRYNQLPFEISGEAYDPSRPVDIPGSEPAQPSRYDYWDHLHYVIDRACDEGVYVFLNPAFGEYTIGSYSGRPSQYTVFDEKLAYDYGRWIGGMYRDKTNLVWLLGGDRNALSPLNDHRALVVAMAEGIADGVNGKSGRDSGADYSSTLMTYWPRKSMPAMSENAVGFNSSEWFHSSPWLDFNSIQDWGWDQLLAIDHDRQLEPAKPTWLFEGRYERYTQYWTDYQARYQAYLPVFAGGFGHVFGNEIVFFFGRDWTIQQGDNEVWKSELDSPGARSMQHLASLMRVLESSGLSERIPDQDLLHGDQGTVGTYYSNRLQAMRGMDADYAVVYTANGRNIRLDTTALAIAEQQEFWFDPRTGDWQRVTAELQEAGNADGLREYDPPGEPGPSNDWVLVLLPGRVLPETPAEVRR